MILRRVTTQLCKSNQIKQFRPALISTCVAKNGAATASSEIAPVAKEEEGRNGDGKKGYYSWGFDEDPFYDQTLGHFLFFATFTVSFVALPVLYMNKPDYKLEQWAHREAYIELNRRESQGLPLVEPNYVDPAKIQLPSDEELRANNIRIII